MNNEIDLQSQRGKLTREGIEKYIFLTNKQLINCLSYPNASDRSSAIFILSERLGNKSEPLCTLLLKQLEIEEALYTKRLVHSMLLKTDISCLHIIFDALAQKTSRQPRRLPKEYLNIISYPPPKDTITRLLCEMDIHSFNAMLRFTSEAKNEQLYEIIDVLGYCSGKFPQAHKLALDTIIDLHTRYNTDNFMLFKIALCLMSYKYQKSIRLLRALESHENDIISAQARHSLLVLSKTAID